MRERNTFEHEVSLLRGAPMERAFFAPPRARVADRLGQEILQLLWEPIAEQDVAGQADRLRRLERVLDRVSDFDAGTLLARLSPGGDLVVDFDYRLSTPTRERLRAKLRARAKTRPVPPPQPAPTPRSGPPQPQPTPQPTPVTPTPVTPPRPWQWPVPVLPTLVWKPDRKFFKRKWGVFDIYVEPEIEVMCSASPDTTAQLKPKWNLKGLLAKRAQNGGKPVTGPDALELEVQLPKLVSALKIELDEKDGLIVSLSKDFSIGLPLRSAKVQISPHLRASSEVFTVEVSLQGIEGELVFQGVPLKGVLEPKLTVVFRINWLRVLERYVVRRLRDWLAELLRRMIGRAATAALLRALAIGLLGRALAALLLEDAAAAPASPPRFVGGEEALELVESERAAGVVLRLPANATLTQVVQRRGVALRASYASAYADAWRSLLRPGWRDELDRIAGVSWPGFRVLPEESAPAAQWLRWASSGMATERTGLPHSSNAVAHVRRYEKALMFLIAAAVLGLITWDALHDGVKICMHQVTLAGMSLALVQVRRAQNRGTFPFVDEAGRPRTADGRAEWEQIVLYVKKAGISDRELHDRLSAHALEALP